MSQDLQKAVQEICQACQNDPARMMDIAIAVQARFGCVSDDAIDAIAAQLKCPRAKVESLVSFYAFLTKQPQGQIVIRLCNDVIDEMAGGQRVGRVLAEELGVDFGQTTPDGRITLTHTPCIGMSDQAPAALVNDVVVTDLSTDSARQLARELKQHMDPKRLVHKLGDGNNAHRSVHAMVKNNICKPGPVVLADLETGQAIRKAVAMSPKEVIRDLKTARLRGRGGAGFPTGMKWEFTRNAQGDKKYVICNADEGEPGTFKDRVILTEYPNLLFEGMTLAAYAIGSDEGILYLRAEYAYLRPMLEEVLDARRAQGLLGHSICGKKYCFHFDIRIQMGAGAYICGEESSLISSAEGLRGDPKTRPPFPAQRGYLGCPTTVNNVETFCCAARILEQGPGWFSQFGTEGSTGTKLLSVAGDCRRPGVYEVPFGVTMREVLQLVDGEEAIAVQVGGPSGQMIGPDGYDRRICFDDLATGGSIMVFGPERDPLEVASRFMEFFVEESCGYCTPCRVGNVLLKQKLDAIRQGRGEKADLDELKQLGETVKTASRCGLGQTSPNPILTTLENFRDRYEALVRKETNGMQPTFDLGKAVAEAEAIAGRKSVLT